MSTFLVVSENHMYADVVSEYCSNLAEYFENNIHHNLLIPHTCMAHLY